ncbi:receptor-type protein kinase, putative [Bodo saltans]|uniref:Receptor-type protein kinase, putative n=1 Tax=Bodo saltans TaxID=75058 RepID=A0A0S4J9D8_BODSA|nr:receptor-type protein kinase, putative [Bodo saltans]|eukprot:CUG76265.1 receptor-type protein kinase, putative [Bodo saltans]
MNLTETGIKCLTRSLSSSLQNLHTLTLTRPQSFDNTDITHLSELPRLRRLNVNFSSVTDAGLETISRSIPLELLDLRSCRNMSDAGAFHITCMSSSLTALHIHCEHLSEAGLALLSGLVNLQTLGMSCITIPTADQQRIQTVASVLSSMKQLRTLEIQGTDDVDGSFAMVEAVPAQKIQTLKLTTCATAGLGVQMLSSLRRLDRSWGFDVDASLRHLAGLANLVELSLANSDLTDRGLATLRELQCRETLLQLNLSHCCDVTDAGMKEVSHFGGLVELDISACRRVSDVGLWYLSRKLFHLSKLSFRCCPRVSDNGLRYIASTLHRLTELSIGTSAVISDAGILKLAAMPCLVEVDIGKSPLVTADALTLLPCTQKGNGSHFPRPMPLRRIVKGSTTDSKFYRNAPRKV